MARELRLALALGGTGSHGAFGGAALTQAVKLAVVHARHGAPGDRRPYDRVRVDVLSGAGLGVLALAAVLRALACPDGDEESAGRRLEMEFDSHFPPLGPAGQLDLIAAQLAQDVQTDLWTPPDDHDPDGGLSWRKLLGGVNGWTRDLTHEAGLLDRRAVTELARRTLGFGGRPVDVSRRRLLGRRVLFGCTLSNYTPVLHRDRPPLPADETGLIGVGAGMRSRVHTELRVFDLRFDPPPVGPAADDDPSRRWVRAYNGFNAEADRDCNLRDTAFWNEITDTAVASGAVPFAVEPVPLTRYRYEFDGDLWPAALAAFDRYPFTYYHAGDLSCEPVREAFRLANYLDNLPPRPGEAPFDRRVIYVDPTVPSEGAGLRVASYRRFGQADPLGDGPAGRGIHVLQSTTLSRMLPMVGGLASALRDEAEVAEADKVYDVRGAFALRRTVRPALLASLAAEPSADAVRQMADVCHSLLRRADDDPMFPPVLHLDAELRRVIEENPDDLRELTGQAFDPTSSPQSPRAAAWLRALTLVAADAMLGLAGKREASKLVTISPVQGVGATRGERFGRGDLDKLTTIRLPSAEYGGLAGLMSATAAEVAVAHGKAAAGEFLHACGLIDAAPDAALRPSPELSPAELEAVAGDVRRGMGHLADRVGSMVRQWGGLKFGLLTGPIRSLLGTWAANRVLALLDRPAGVAHEFRIYVPDDGYEFAGTRLFDRRFAAREVGDVGGRLALICFARLDERGTWHGPQVHAGAELRINRRDRRVATLPLPNPAAVRRAELWPNPIFELSLGESDDASVEGWTVDPGVRELS